MNISVAGKTIKIRKSGFICLLQKYIIYVYLSIMSNNFGFIDIILLAMIAGFIILRLRSILGRKTGYEEKIYPGFVDKKFETPKESASPQNNIDPLTKSLEGRERSDFLKGARLLTKLL